MGTTGFDGENASSADRKRFRPVCMLVTRADDTTKVVR